MKIPKWVLFLFAGILFVFPALNFAQSSVSDTLKICALRVQFQKDTNDLTTGNGQFMIDTTTTDAFAIDPAPHNKQYFQDHITAAANYFKSVSKGRLVVIGSVFPSGADGAFTLNKPMGAYNPNTTDEEIDKGISRLFVDAVKTADASGENIDFSKYDLVVIFHAGVGRDVDLGYDPTPQDIPSLYLSNGFLKKALGDTFSGITVNGGKVKINSGILLPETENQAGHAIALTGFLVSNIGSYLGLYDLFSPTTKHSGIGRFGLMDAGLLNLNGLVPAPPSAFSRMLLGWDQPVTINAPQANIPVARLFAQNPVSAPTLYKVPVNDDEYYLIECRGNPAVNIDSLYQTLYTENDPEPTYLKVLKTFFRNQIEFGPSGVLTKVTNYDWGLPGSGILIWHIDERIIREKGAQNKVNDDSEQRGVALVEADAAQDIGQNYSLLDAGYQTELGWFADFWFKNRPSYIKNFELYTNEFSSKSHPASFSNRDHAFTHVKLYDFSNNSGDVMTFSFTREMSEAGFPFSVTHQSKMTHWIAASFDSNHYFYLSDRAGNVWAVSRNKTNGQPEAYKVWVDSTEIRKLTFVYGDNFRRLIITTPKHFLIVPYNARFASMNPAKRLLWNAPADITAGPVSVGGKLYLACANDSLYEFQVSDSKLALTDRKAGFGKLTDLAVTGEGIPADLAGLDGAASVAVSVGGEAGKVFFVLQNKDNGSYTRIIANGETHAFKLPEKPSGNLVLMKAHADRAQIVFNGRRKIYAFNFNGTPVTQFPLMPVLDADDSLVGAPIVCDINNDGKPEITAVTAKGVVVSVGLDNRMIANFPLSVGGQVHLSPILLQWDNDQAAELAVVTDDGNLYAWNLDGSSADVISWGQAGKDGTNNKIFKIYPPPPANKIGEGDFLPAEKVYNYPNPNQGDFTTIRFYLTEPASVTVRIFDLAGNQIQTFSVKGQGSTDNEVVWDVRNVASGVYLCQVEAKASGKTQRRLFKIMVVH